MNKEIVKKEPEEENPQTIKEWLSSTYFKKQVMASLPRHLTAERFMRVALTALMRNPKLNHCTQKSVLKCMLDCSMLGLEPDGRRAHLIPYKDECTLIIDYKGLVELIYRSGEVSYIHADKVCENDKFKYNLGRIEIHEVDLRKPRGEAYAFYAIIKMKDGTEKHELMSKEEVDKIRNRSKASKNGPWVTDYMEMAKKTVFRRASKWVPLSAEIMEKIESDDEPIEVEAKFEAARPIFDETDEEEPRPEPAEGENQEDPQGSEPSPSELLRIRLSEYEVDKAAFVRLLRQKKIIGLSYDLESMPDKKAEEILENLGELIKEI